jgi:hypothetical protein
MIAGFNRKRVDVKNSRRSTTCCMRRRLGRADNNGEIGT